MFRFICSSVSSLGAFWALQASSLHNRFCLLVVSFPSVRQFAPFLIVLVLPRKIVALGLVRAESL